MCTGSKGINPGVLQEASDNAGDYDIFRLAWNTGNQTADAAYDQVDAHACTGCLHQLVDQFTFRDSIGFDDDSALWPLLDFSVYGFQDARFHAGRCSQKLFMAGTQISYQHVFKEADGILGDDRIGSHQAEVCVQ